MGWFERCGAYGSVFLDEIGELDPAIQVKLLRVLQSRELQRIGETTSRRFDGKIIAATHRDLGERIDAGRRAMHHERRTTPSWAPRVVRTMPSTLRSRV